jgi:type IV pilus assembly protein PilZ
MQSTIENRMFPRVNVEWFVVARTAQSAIEGVTLNVSPGGVFVRCKNPPRVNEVFNISLSIPEAERSLTAKAEVVWSNIYGLDDEITPRGMGVRFLNISVESRAFIAKVVLDQLEPEKTKPELMNSLKNLVLDTLEIELDAE